MMRTCICEECGSECQDEDENFKYSTWMRCPECQGKAVLLDDSRSADGNLWKRTGGYAGESGVGSLARAIHVSQVKERMEIDRQRGVDHLVEWVRDKGDRPGRRGMARPKFRSRFGRREYDRAYGVHDPDDNFGGARR